MAKNNETNGMFKDCMDAATLAGKLLEVIEGYEFNGRTISLATSMLAYSVHKITLMNATEETVTKCINEELRLVKGFIGMSGLIKEDK